MLFSQRYTFERRDIYGNRFKHIYYDKKRAQQLHNYYQSNRIMCAHITHIRGEWQIRGDCYEQIIDLNRGVIIKKLKVS